ncbi:zinc finger MYM-type protein 1-like [Olea europaea var. sylvestris]|uniref:zinc finger MYM-type protein 1-like n=1 Tax=Olea europaea var. sylvestris TaxID=158386 RepID=UPI000C1D754D|nr:zinc finger MYM-type protein 1-like [Olea europaea var. sylvestris]
MAFRGHDESEDSNNQGNFLELLHWLCDHNPEIKAVALTNAPENLKLTSPRVQKDIVSAIASECLHVIIENIRDSFFSILVDESRDISVKEQMSVVIRYVKNGCILEHFIGVIHVLNTTTASLKAAIDQLFSMHSLSISNLRGQGYDGASNIRAKRSDLIRENQRLKILESLNIGEISSGRGLNQEITLQRPGDTRWGSHYSCLINLITMFSTIVEVIEMIATDSTSTGTRDFEELQGISDLAQKLVVKNKHEVYPLVYKLVTLTLVLPVATATVKRAFSAMTYVKNRLRNRIGDQWLNDSLIAYIEKDVFDEIENDAIDHYETFYLHAKPSIAFRSYMTSCTYKYSRQEVQWERKPQPQFACSICLLKKPSEDMKEAQSPVPAPDSSASFASPSLAVGCAITVGVVMFLAVAVVWYCTGNGYGGRFSRVSMVIFVVVGDGCDDIVAGRGVIVIVTNYLVAL